jgi:hypothetical protein
MDGCFVIVGDAYALGFDVEPGLEIGPLCGDAGRAVVGIALERLKRSIEVLEEFCNLTTTSSPLPSTCFLPECNPEQTSSTWPSCTRWHRSRASGLEKSRNRPEGKRRARRCALMMEER